MPLLNTIHSPNDIKVLNKEQLKDLADEIRSLLIEVTSKNGGHLASNLGVVELTIALHRVFDSPKDKIIFDVSHQTYVHKLLTGRNDEKFLNLRSFGGYSGFFDPDYSPHDPFIAGHAGTALSIALGFAYARDKLSDPTNKNQHIVVVLGDAALSCGTTLEALNNVCAHTQRLIIVLNDNEFSIDKNVGATSLYLNELIRSDMYKKITNFCKKILGNGPFGRSIIRKIRNLKRAIKGILLPTSYFEYYGLRYIGPIKGHDITQLEEVLEFCKTAESPILVHVKTIKGKGLHVAENNPEKFHGIEGRTEEIACAEHINISYSEVLGREIVKLASKDSRIVGITAAMAHGTGLRFLREAFPQRYIDVGIAEGHAVTFAGALAKAGMRPICAIYSTFLQRAFDQILHDICIQNLPVIFCLDRAGAAVKDGVTHHGIFDLSYLRLIPNSVIVQPKNGQDFVNIIHSAFDWCCPVFIRYPKSYVSNSDLGQLTPSAQIKLGDSEKLADGSDVCIISLGNMIEMAYAVKSKLEKFEKSIGIVNARFIKPLNEDFFLNIYSKNKIIVTMEDNVLAGGFGSAVLELYNSKNLFPKLLRFGWPDKFFKHGSSTKDFYDKIGLSADNIVNKILTCL